MNVGDWLQIEPAGAEMGGRTIRRPAGPYVPVGGLPLISLVRLFESGS
jgi:hypothetical protein